MPRFPLLPCLTCVALALALAFACSGTTDPASTAAWASCAKNSECTVAKNSCCDLCGSPGLDDVDAVNENHVDRHFRAVCPKPLPCPKCATSSNPDIVATCAEGACKAVDVTEHSVSACSSDEDCRLRVTACCECGGATAPFDLIAIARKSESAYTALVCDEGQACLACAPVYPSEVEAYCSSGHCAVREALPDICALPFDPGPCDAAMRVFSFVDGECVEMTYGGCEGNDNRFATLEQCMAACEGRPNPNGCPAGRVARHTCLECGPAGGCGKYGDVCAKVCESNSDCDTPLWYCADGACEVGGCI